MRIHTDQLFRHYYITMQSILDTIDGDIGADVYNELLAAVRTSTIGIVPVELPTNIEYVFTPYLTLKPNCFNPLADLNHLGYSFAKHTDTVRKSSDDAATKPGSVEYILERYAESIVPLTTDNEYGHLRINNALAQTHLTEVRFITVDNMTSNPYLLAVRSEWTDDELAQYLMDIVGATPLRTPVEIYKGSTSMTLDYTGVDGKFYSYSWKKL